MSFWGISQPMNQPKKENPMKTQATPKHVQSWALWLFITKVLLFQAMSFYPALKLQLFGPHVTWSPPNRTVQFFDAYTVLQFYVLFDKHVLVCVDRMKHWGWVVARSSVAYPVVLTKPAIVAKTLVDSANLGGPASSPWSSNSAWILSCRYRFSCGGVRP